VVSEVVHTVVENARRLLKDAELLFENERYRSAAALAILSIEESGKACVIRWREEGFISRNIQKDIRHFHFHKQRVLCCFLFSEEILVASEEYYDVPSNIPKIEKKKNEFETEKEYLTYIWQKFVDRDNKDYLEFIAERSAKRAFEYALFVETGTIDSFKQHCFYTDIDENLALHLPFGAPDRDDAEECLSLAKTAVGIPLRSLMLQKMMAAVYEIGPIHGDPKDFAKARYEALRSRGNKPGS
jgi:AbiV family abortive infection protein